MGEVSIERRALEWFAGDDTGVSSKTLACHMLGIKPKGMWSSYPFDPADLGRCLRLLELIPEWKPRVAEMAAVSEVWARMAERWQEMHDAMAFEVGIDWSKGREAPRTYDLMKEIRGARH